MSEHSSSDYSSKKKNHEQQHQQEVPATPEAGKPGAKDMEGIALLRQIFPELSVVELHRLHTDNLRKSARNQRQVQVSEPTSALGQRIWKQSVWLEDHPSASTKDDEEEEFPIRWRTMELPDDFLRLPPDLAVRRFNDKNGTWYYLMINRLEQQVLEQHAAHQDFSGAPTALPPNQDYYTRVLHRDVKTGLGMTLCEEGARIWVHSLLGRDASKWFVAPPESEEGGAAMKVGILPGDWLLGINGQAMLPLPSGHRALLKDAVSTIHYSADPIVLHLRRVPADKWHPLVNKNGDLQSVPLNSQSLLDATIRSGEPTTDGAPVKPKGPRIHPFVLELEAKGLMKSVQDQVHCTQRLSQFTERARQWESFSSFRLDARSYNLCYHFDPKDLPPEMCSESLPFEDYTVENIRPYAPSTPTLDPKYDEIPSEYQNSTYESFASADSDETSTFESNNLLNGKPVDLQKRDSDLTPRKTFPGRRLKQQRRASDANTSDIFIPLMGVRKALCIRIVNTFLEENRTAYTIWVIDVESGREWYAPVRYLRDFQDLRSAALPLCPTLAQLPFPQQSWNVFGREKVESVEIRAAKCRQMEYFLRKLSNLLYTEKLHPVISEISIHLQSFLGCDAAEASLRLKAQITLNEAMVWQMPETNHSFIQMKVRLLLKRSIQRYVFRLFLLDQMQTVVNDFVDATRKRGPQLRDIEVIEAQGRNKLKERAMEDLDRIQAFMDQMQTIILHGCHADLLSISKRRDFSALRPFMEGSLGDAYLDRVFRESVREQIEIEIYVPLRGVVSRLLVNGWRHDDMEIQFKMNELRRRSQSKFRIPADKESPSGWTSVSSVLNEGVGMSTLPCAKLRAIVDSAKEISRVYAEEKSSCDDKEFKDDLGADDFLPIFIYCVVQAEMERPCALCVLLRTLCEPTNRIGEIGYYLASFEAAITHIQEINLAEP